MIIPEKLKIGGHSFTIELVEGFKSEDDDMGECISAKNLIKIRKGMVQDQMEASLIHEIFHAINTTLDHELLDSISEQFYQVLKDNNLLK